MKMTEYPVTTRPDQADICLLDGSDGTRKMNVGEFSRSTISLNAPMMHRLLFRGQNLGSSVTANQKTAITNGTFEDLYLGDYWVIGGTTWRIVDFDYWYGTGDTECTEHHVVIMPDSNLGQAAMNATATTSGGYSGCQMRSANMNTAKSTIQGAFGSSILNHREYLINAVSSGYPSAGVWTDSEIELPNEPMIFGSYIYTPGSTGSITPKRYTNSATQLALFAVDPTFICKPAGASARIAYWLRDAVNGTSFVRVSSYGSPQDTSATQSYGIRPVFGITG